MKKLCLLFVCCTLLVKGTNLTEVEHLLSLSYTSFDQTPGQGWRAFIGDDASPQQFVDIARVIERYIEYHKATLSRYELQILHFHAGQLYAFAEENDVAIFHFKKSYDYSLDMHKVFPHEQSYAWLLYVGAKIAFLEHDINALQACAQELQNKYPNTLGGNTEIVLKLLKYHDKPYRQVYRS